MLGRQAPLSLLSAWGFACAIAVVNGLGRFAYALLLPVMRSDLAWDYALSGWLNTANSLGYGAGALAGLWLLGRCQAKDLFVAGLAITLATLALCALTTDLTTMMLWRFLSGVGSAWVFACGGALVASAYSANSAKAGAAIAIYYAGGGLGIAASGLLLAPVLTHAWTWQTGWAVLAWAGLALSAWPVALALRMQTSAQPANKDKNKDANPVPGTPATAIHWPNYQRMLWAYFLFGVGYIVYLTFVIAWLKEMQLGPSGSIAVWVVLGASVTASGWVWRRPMSQWWAPRTFATASVCTAVGSVLPVASNHVVLLLVSAMLVGGSFFMVPASMMALARATLAPAAWAKAMSVFTAVFALGQALGPVLAGWLADRWGLATAMVAGGLALCAGAALAARQNSAAFSGLTPQAR